MTMRKCYACSSMSANKQPLNEFPNKFKINKKLKKSTKLIILMDQRALRLIVNKVNQSEPSQRSK